MASTQTKLFTNSTYNDYIQNEILISGGTLIFMRDNVMMVSEITEEQYIALLNDPYVDKVDVLPLKRYANEGIKYNKITI